MKKMLMSVLMLAIALTARADGDRLIDREQLPAKAREFLATHFGDKAVSLAKVDREIFDLRYEVVLVDGEKIEFTRSGEWDEVSCRYASVPVEIIPKAIYSQINQRYPDVVVRAINREFKHYEVKLSNGMELIFDRNFRLIGYDD